MMRTVKLALALLLPVSAVTSNFGSFDGKVPSSLEGIENALLQLAAQEKAKAKRVDPILKLDGSGYCDNVNLTVIETNGSQLLFTDYTLKTKVDPTVAVDFSSPVYKSYTIRAIERCYTFDSFTNYVAVNKTGGFKCYKNKLPNDFPQRGEFAKCQADGDSSAQSWRDMTHKVEYIKLKSDEVCHSQIKNAEECRQAAGIIGYPYQQEFNDPSNPRVCQWVESTKGSYYNDPTLNGGQTLKIQADLSAGVGSICQDPDYYNHTLYQDEITGAWKASERGSARPQLDYFLTEVQKVLEMMKQEILLRVNGSQYLYNTSWEEFLNCSYDPADDPAHNLTELNKTHWNCSIYESSSYASWRDCDNRTNACNKTCNATCDICLSECSADPVPIGCIYPDYPDFPPIPHISSLPYLQEMYQKFSGKYDRCKNCTDSCEDCTCPKCCEYESGWRILRKECTEHQHALEEASCQNNKTDKCQEYEDCYHHRYEVYKIREAERNLSWADSKDEWRSILRIECILNAFWESIHEERNLDDGITFCREQHYQTTQFMDHLTPIWWPTDGIVKNSTSCSGLNNATVLPYLPGTDAWTAAFYTNMPENTGPERCGASCGIGCINHPDDDDIEYGLEHEESWYSSDCLPYNETGPNFNTTWHVAATPISCEALCLSMSPAKTCDQAAMTDLTTEEAVGDKFAEAGFTCSDYQSTCGENCAAVGAPFVKTTGNSYTAAGNGQDATAEKCDYGNVVALCSQVPADTANVRLCACKAEIVADPPVPSPPGPPLPVPVAPPAVSPKAETLATALEIWKMALHFNSRNFQGHDLAGGTYAGEPVTFTTQQVTHGKYYVFQWVTGSTVKVYLAEGNGESPKIMAATVESPALLQEQWQIAHAQDGFYDM